MQLETLLAERAIYRQLVRLARAMDQRDWQAFETITTTNMEADTGTGLLAGRDAFIACLRSFLDGCGPTQHLLGNVLIEVEGDRATSRAYVSDMHIGAGDKAKSSFQTLGDYHDQWQLIDGQWLLTFRKKHNRAHLGDISILGPGDC